MRSNPKWVELYGSLVIHSASRRDVTCYVSLRLALLHIKLKCVTVVLDSIHNPTRHTNECYMILNRYKLNSNSCLDKAG